MRSSLPLSRKVRSIPLTPLPTGPFLTCHYSRKSSRKLFDLNFVFILTTIIFRLQLISIQTFIPQKRLFSSLLPIFCMPWWWWNLLTFFSWSLFRIWYRWSSIIQKLLCFYVLSGSILDWLRFFIYGRWMSVCFHSVTSLLTPMNCGIPQGSVLGPVAPSFCCCGWCWDLRFVQPA